MCSIRSDIDQASVMYNKQVRCILLLFTVGGLVPGEGIVLNLFIRRLAMFGVSSH